jgi:hypothetical protein
VLGSAVTEAFNASSWRTVSADVVPGVGATFAITLAGVPAQGQLALVMDSLKSNGIHEGGLDAVICTAGGFAGMETRRCRLLYDRSVDDYLWYLWCVSC